MVYINPNVYIAVAILLLLIPLDWLTAAAVAAAFHEICHMGIIYVTGGTIEAINIGIGGTEIVAVLNGKRKELLAILSGPAGSFLLMGLCHIFPKLSIVLHTFTYYFLYNMYKNNFTFIKILPLA